MGIYRPPGQSSKSSCSRYIEKVEEELNEICMWASLQKQLVILLGDLNMDRLRPETREGKILKDLEDVHGLQCMITEPTRITQTTETLLDVILINKPQMFKKCGTVDPVMSDHKLVYGIMAASVRHYKPKVITFRSDKNTNVNQLNEDLRNAPWHSGEIYGYSK